MPDDRRNPLDSEEWRGLKRDDLAAMGLVTMRFQQVDSTLSTVISALLAHSPFFFRGLASIPHDEWHLREEWESVGTIVSTGLFSFRNKINVAFSLAVLRFTADDPSVARLQAVTKRCLKAEQDRNTLIHSWWIPAAGGAERWTTRIKHRLDHERGLSTSGIDERLDQAVFIELADRLAQLDLELIEIITKFYPLGADPDR